MLRVALEKLRNPSSQLRISGSRRRPPGFHAALPSLVGSRVSQPPRLVNEGNFVRGIPLFLHFRLALVPVDVPWAKDLRESRQECRRPAQHLFPCSHAAAGSRFAGRDCGTLTTMWDKMVIIFNNWWSDPDTQMWLIQRPMRILITVKSGVVVYLSFFEFGVVLVLVVGDGSVVVVVD